MNTTLLPLATILLVSLLPTRASELDDDLGLSVGNVSTNSVEISTNLLNSISQGACGTSIDILDTSPDPFFPEVALRAIMQWGNAGGDYSGRVVVRQFATGTNALQWVLSMVHGTSMAEDCLSSHYSVRPSINDICLCWHAGETNKLDSSISSVTILRGNLVTLTSGTRGTNLVEAASSIMDAICAPPIQ